MNSTLRIKRNRTPGVSTRVTTIGYNVLRADTSRQITEEDVLSSLSATGVTALIPPYEQRFLYACVERSNMLKQCIAAMVTNIALCGFDIVPIRPGVEIDEGEREELQSFIEAANSEESLTAVHAKVVEDYESCGYGYIEVIRDRLGRMSLWRHAKSLNTLMTVKDPDPQTISYSINRGRRVAVVTELRCFRKFVQVVNGKARYFKEFGDPRTLNMNTGEFGRCSQAEEATEIFHIRQNSNDPYGVPRWINQLPSILGSRESEECNLRYFEENTIPPMILSVSGGRLTKQSYQELTNILQKQGIGQERQHKLILIEAVPERDSLDDKGTVTLKLDKLTDARQSDGLFREYDDGNQAKVRSSFRLPPVAVGLSQDVTFATANVSAFIAESQVYLPQRSVFDELYNKNFVNNDLGLGLTTCKLISKVPMTSNSETIIKSLTALNVMGAITPRMANELANKVLQVEVDKYPEIGEEGYEEWMDKPIIFVTKGTASDAGQNQKDPTTKAVEGGAGPSMRQPEHGQE